MKTLIRIFAISALIIAAGCTKEEEPQKELRKGINIVKPIPVTKSAEADSTNAKGRPAHLPIAPVYGGETDRGRQGYGSSGK